jgi:hypothetical protein
MRKLFIAGLAASLGLVALAPAASAHGRDDKEAMRGTAKLSLLHGIPGPKGFPVDITLTPEGHGKPTTFAGVTFGTLADQLSVPSGEYDVAIRPAGTATVALEGEVELRRNANVTVVAYLSESGAPALKAFRNDTKAPAAGQAKVTVRHTAQAPSVDIFAGPAGGPATAKVIAGLVNGRQGKVSVPAGTYSIDVALTADNTTRVPLGNNTFAAGKNTIVYAIGSLTGGSFTVRAQVVG